MKLAPITVFCYNRLDNLKVTINALQNNLLAAESDLIIFSDGPKNLKDDLLVNNVRLFLNTITGFKSITIHLSEKNKGLANSIIEGVEHVLHVYDTIIVLEDDVKTSRNFLLFMNSALNKFQSNEKVFSISGYSYPFKKNNDILDGFFLPRLCSFAWATYKRSWQNVNWKSQAIFTSNYANSKKFKKEFNQGGSDLFGLLKKDEASKINSWAIRWSYHQMLNKGLTFYPRISKVQNIGFEKEATNSNTFNKYFSDLDDGISEGFLLPDEVQVDSYYLNQLQQFYSLKNRLMNRLKTYLVSLNIIKNRI